MNQPKNYRLDLPRVSKIVESIYPFEWEAKSRFLDWLRKLNIDVDDYMDEASIWWTYIHKAMEVYWLTKKWTWRKYKNIIASWIQFYKDFNVKVIANEVYIVCEDYQWTLDCIADIDWEEYIIDWKSYWLAKEKFWLPNNYRKPYDKLKKARLQLSLYNRTFGYKYKLAVVELTNSGYYFHIIEQIPPNELEEIINKALWQ